MHICAQHIEQLKSVIEQGAKIAEYKAKTGNNNSTVTQIQEKLYELGFTSQITVGYYGDIIFLFI